MRRLTTARVALAAAASEIARHDKRQDSIANRLNREQLSWVNRGQLSHAAADSPKSGWLDAEAAEIGILFLRRDGGDPKELRVDDNALIYIAGRTGEGRAYQNGRQVEIHPAVKESVGQIAAQQFHAPAGAQVLPAELPATAQQALTRFAEGRRATPRVIFARATSREDTARVSEMRATKILGMQASLKAAHPLDMVERVRTAMLIFGFKADACDVSGDARCDQPGVREAFAQIKREEAIRWASAAR
jgi:hypothetical protein